MRLCAVLLAVIGLASGASAGELNENLFGTVFPRYQEVGTPRLPDARRAVSSGNNGAVSSRNRRAASRPVPHRDTALRSVSAAKGQLNENLFGTVFPVSQVTDMGTPQLPDGRRAVSSDNHGAVSSANRDAASHPVMAAPHRDTALRSMSAAAPVLWNWTGFYIGGHIGYAMGLNNIADPLGPSIFGDDVRSPGLFGGGQIGGNWQAPNSNWVFGVEADASFGDLDGTNTCYAYSGTFTSFNCRAHTDAFGTLTGRVGWAFGPNGRILAYVKGGGAWAHSNVDMIINNNLAGVTGSTSTRINPLGWTVGVGAEYAMRAHWSVKAEYDYMDFGSSSVGAPSPSVNTVANTSFIIPSTSLIPVPGTSVSQQIHVFKLGLNYKFGPNGPPFPDGNGAPMAWVSHGADGWAVGWPVEVGARYWYSSGRFQKDLAGDVSAQNPTLNVSRLTWDNLTGNSGELFARLDTPLNFFVKGFVGGGKLSGGKVNDEDWGLQGDVNTGYSNTVGDASGSFWYGTVDAGYNVLRGAGYKVGVFAGYNYYKDDKSTFTCAQIALPASGFCSPPISGLFIGGEDDTWQSARVGGNAEVMLTPNLKLVADVAFLPYVKFNGQDTHALRNLILDESGTGIGTQAELFLSAYLTPQFSIGVGGRYWAMWTNSGTICFPEGCQGMQFKTERYGVLFQGAYKWDQTGRPTPTWKN